MLSGAFFLAKSVLDLVVGDPPRTAAELLAWKATHQVSLAWANEVLVFAAVFLIPGVLALYRSLGGPGRPWAGFGCGIMAATVPVLLTVAMVQGRLVYPVYDLNINDSADLALVVTLYVGGAHEVSVLLAGALIILGVLMARSVQFRIAAGTLGVTAGVAQLAGSYPWLIGPSLSWITQALLVAWLVLSGVRLMQTPRTAMTSVDGARQVTARMADEHRAETAMKES
jgi:hypothetical protein